MDYGLVGGGSSCCATSLHRNICAKNNVEMSDCGFVYPPWGPGSQCREASYQFLLVIYDKEFHLRASMTAGVPGRVYSYQETEANNNQFYVIDQIDNNVIFINYWSTHGDLGGPIVYINQDLDELSQGFYIWAVNHKDQLVSLVPFMGTLGPFEVIGNLHLDLIESTRVCYYNSQLLAAKTTQAGFIRTENVAVAMVAHT